MSWVSGFRELWISGLEGSIFRVPRANLGTAGAGVRGFEDSGFPGLAIKGRAQNGFRDSKFQGLREFEFRVPRKMDSGFQVFKDSVLFRTARESLRISKKLAGAPIILHRASASRTSSRKQLGRVPFTCTSAAGRVVLASVIHVVVV